VDFGVSVPGCASGAAVEAGNAAAGKVAAALQARVQDTAANVHSAAAWYARDDTHSARKLTTVAGRVP
jgi:hypothetical protein